VTKMDSSSFLPSLPRNHTYLENAAAVAVGNDMSYNNNQRTPSSSSCGAPAAAGRRIEITIPIVELPIVIFPTETLPLRLYDGRVVAHLRRQIQRGEPARLGVVWDPTSSGGGGGSAEGEETAAVEQLVGPAILQHERHRLGGIDRCFPLGTIATIAFTHQPNGAVVLSGLTVTAIGTHRFVYTMDHRRRRAVNAAYDDYGNGDRIEMCHVVELRDESTSPLLLAGPYLQHLPKFMRMSSPSSSSSSSKQPQDDDHHQPQSHDQASYQTLRRLSMVTGVPLWDRILAQRWPHQVMGEIETLLRQSVALRGLLCSCSGSTGTTYPTRCGDDGDEMDNDTHHNHDPAGGSGGGGYNYPTDPEAFSYWLSANLPVDQRLKATSLSILSVGERLSYLKRLVCHIESSAVICCRRCQSRIAWARDIITVPGADGVSGNYVNPHGVVHQTLTVRQLVVVPFNESISNVVTYWGHLESQESWFPGYQWIIMSCGTCRNHLGWKFVRRLLPVLTAETETPPSLSSPGGVSGGDTATRTTPTAMALPTFFGLSASQVATHIKSNNGEPSSDEDDDLDDDDDSGEDDYLSDT
jgi:Yippee zinc-binding/DNA-binding /Mis18, centromere assembly